MKKFELFIKKNYKLIIPVCLLVVVFISFLIYYKVMMGNNYHVDTEEVVYQYFNGEKYQYNAVVSKNKKGVVVDFKPKDREINLDSTPIYYNSSSVVLFPKNMSVVMPTISCSEYLAKGYSYIDYNKGIYHLTTDKYYGKLNHYFLFDGKDLYFFIEPVELVIGKETIKLSSYSYITTSYSNVLAYYDKKNDTYKSVSLNDEDVYVQNDYYKIYLLRDTIDYQGQNVILTSDLEQLNTIDKKG